MFIDMYSILYRICLKYKETSAPGALLKGPDVGLDDVSADAEDKRSQLRQEVAVLQKLYAKSGQSNSGAGASAGAGAATCVHLRMRAALMLSKLAWSRICASKASLSCLSSANCAVRDMVAISETTVNI